MSTEIVVRGSFSVFQPPERGTVHATIAFEGPTIEPVYQRVADELEAVKASIEPLHNPEGGPVTWWSTQQLRTWSNRPWNNAGEELPLVHHASIGVQVKFSDFTALSRWVGGHISDTGGFEMSRIEWALTAEHREDLVAEAHAGAVRDAVARAQRYADALGLGTVRPVAIADAGMLGQSPPEPGPARFMGVMAAPGGRSEVEFAPVDIEVSLVVDARFVAGTDVASA